jgi:multiple antibiotic resistance protein
MPPSRHARAKKAALRGVVNYSAFLATFMALFAISSPIANVPLFVAATAAQNGRQRRQTALIAASTYVVAGLAVLFAGNAALAFFGVNVSALRLAGMAVVAVIGWRMINAPTVVAQPNRPARPHRLHAASNTRIAAQPTAWRPAPSPLSVGVTPLGFPIYAGPGVLSLVIAWGSSSQPAYAMAAVAIFANAAVILGLNTLANPITRIIGAEGLLVTEKLSGLIVVAIAVGGMAGALLVLFPGLQGLHR